MEGLIKGSATAVDVCFGILTNPPFPTPKKCNDIKYVFGGASGAAPQYAYFDKSTSAYECCGQDKLSYPALTRSSTVTVSSTTGGSSRKLMQ